MLDRDIEQLMGAYSQVLKPRKPLKPVRESTVMALDTEFDSEGLISLCLAWQSPTDGSVCSKLYFSEKPSITIENLHGLIVDFCAEFNIPAEKTTFLTCHFAQSELQHIPDLWQKLKIRVYNKSMFGEWESPEGYECSGSAQVGKAKLKIVDSYAHFLCGLDKVAKSVGAEKVCLEGVDNKPESFWKNNMRLLLEKHRDVFEKYARQDSEVLVKAFNQRRQFFHERFGLDILTLATSAQTSSQVFTTMFLKEPVEPAKFEWAPYNRQVRGEWKTGWKRLWVYSGSRDKRYFSMKSYWGGRREAFYRGLIPEPVEVWDVKSMYPTMAKLPLPNQHTKWVFIEGYENLQSIVDGVGYAHCQFKFPESTDYPCLPVFDSRFPKLVFPLEGESWCTTYELKLALKMNCEVKNVKAWVFYPTNSEKNHPLRNFMEHFTELKNQSPEGSMPYEASKLLMNSLIGKFCQRDPEYSVETYQNVLASLGYDYTQFQQVMKSLEWRQKFKNPINVGSSWAPEWSSLILGSSRAVISEIMWKSEAITGHTDSVMVFKGSKVECEATEALRALGSALEHKTQYDSDSFWICRSAVYSPIRNGVCTKPTHHGYPVDRHEDFGEIVEANLKAQKPTISECFKTHLTTPKEALRSGMKLGAQITKKTVITWDWDYKRRLQNPHVNLWREYSPSKPWKNTEEILQALNKLQPTSQKWKKDKPKGRPENKVPLQEILEDRKQGLTIRQIAQKHGVSVGYVHGTLKNHVHVHLLCTKQYTHFLNKRKKGMWV